MDKTVDGFHPKELARQRLRRAAVAAALCALGLLAVPVAAGATRAVAARHAVAARVTVSVSDTKLALSPSGLQSGRTTFVVVNLGKRPHRLSIQGPGVKSAQTPELAPGKRAVLTVTLQSGAYMLTFSNPRGLGMSATRWIQVIPNVDVSAKGNSSVTNASGDTSMCGYLAP